MSDIKNPTTISYNDISIGVSSGKFLKLKNHIMYLQVDNVYMKLASFKGNKEAKIFNEFLNGLDKGAVNGLLKAKEVYENE